MTRPCNRWIFDRLLVLFLHMLYELSHGHPHPLQSLAQRMILIGHGLLECCHQFVVLRWGLGGQNGRLDNCLQLPDDLGPRVCICRNNSILNLLGYLCLLGLPLHLLSHSLDLGLQGNILRIGLRVRIYHGAEFCRWRWWIVGRAFERACRFFHGDRSARSPRPRWSARS